MYFNFKEKYADEEEIKQAIAEYNEGVSEEDEVRYCSYYDSHLRRRFYVVCSKEYFYDWRNMLSEERQKAKEAKSCLVESVRYKNTPKLCRHYKKDCYFAENCPYINEIRYAANGVTYYPGYEVEKVKVYSLDQAYEDYELEVVDPSYTENESNYYLYEAIESLSEEDQLIIKLFMENRSDVEIAEILNKPRTTVNTRKNRLFEILLKKLN